MVVPVSSVVALLLAAASPDVTALELDAGASLAYVGLSDGKIRIVDADTGDVILTWSGIPLRGPEQAVAALRLASPRCLVAARRDGSLQIWGLEQRTLTRVVAAGLEEVVALAVSPHGTHAVVSGAGGDLTRVSLATGKLTWRRKLRHGVATALEFSPDGKLLALGFEDGAVELWDSKTGRKRWGTAPAPDKEPSRRPAVDGLTFSPDGTRLAAASHARLAIFAATGGAPAHLLDAELTDVAFAPDGRAIALGAEAFAISKDMKTRTTPVRVGEGSGWGVLSGDGRCAAWVGAAPGAPISMVDLERILEPKQQ